jgi:hypothetical protein
MLVEKTVGALQKFAEFYERAAAFRGRPRERMVALGEADELFYRLYPHHYQALQIVRVAAQTGHPHHRHGGPLRRCESRAVRLLSCVVMDAIAERDLKLSSSQQVDDLVFSVWALVFGTRALMGTLTAQRQLGIADGYAVSSDTSELLFDALGWRPLSDEWDYERTRQRVRTQIFAAEWPAESAA